MLASLLILIISLFILLKASEMLVDSSVSIARFYGVTEFFIGSTIIALGTSLPELASSISAALSKHTGIVLGNVVGSNITNITLILGVASILITMNIKQVYFEKKTNFLIAITVLFFIVSLDRAITFIEGMFFLVIFVYYLYRQHKEMPKTTEVKLRKLLDGLFGDKLSLKDLTQEEKDILRHIDYKTSRHLREKGIDITKILERSHFFRGGKYFGAVILSIAGIILSAKYLVISVVSFAQMINISEEIIAMSIVAFGTSIPELAVTFTSARKHLPNILIGNLIGSNIANLLLVAGISSLITPLIISPFSIWFIMPFMIVSTIMLRNYIRTKWMSRLFEGFVFLFFYAIFLFFLFLSSGF